MSRPAPSTRRSPRRKFSPVSISRVFRSCAPGTKPLTLRNLLTHTSGFSYPLWDTNVLRYLKFARGHPGLPRMPLMFEPGTRWAYGGSLDRVGRMVEIAGGQSLDTYFRDNITGPLGMNDTGFSITDQQRTRQASLHVRKADGKLLPQPLEKPKLPSVPSGGGSLYSTAPDYLALLQALLNGGSFRGASILKPETVALMSTTRLATSRPGNSRPRTRRFPTTWIFPAPAMGARPHDQCRPN